MLLYLFPHFTSVAIFKRTKGDWTWYEMLGSCILKSELTGAYFSIQWAQWPPPPPSTSFLSAKPQSERCVIRPAACFHSQKYIFLSWILLISFLSASMQSCKYECIAFFILLHSAGDCILYISLENYSVSILLFFFLSIHTCFSETQHSPVWRCWSWKTAAFSSCLLQPLELQQPDRTFCERLCIMSDWWGWAYKGMAARIYGDPGHCISPGVLLWWTAL